MKRKIIPNMAAMTEAEYRANIDGLNMLFGAVLGFVLAGAENLGNLEFAVVLILCTGAVVNILYLAASEAKLFYGIMAIAGVALLPVMLKVLAGGAVIPKLQPTLAVWTGIIVLIELSRWSSARRAKGPDSDT